MRRSLEAAAPYQLSQPPNILHPRSHWKHYSSSHARASAIFVHVRCSNSMSWFSARCRSNSCKQKWSQPHENELFGRHREARTSVCNCDSTLRVDSSIILSIRFSKLHLQSEFVATAFTNFNVRIACHFFCPNRGKHTNHLHESSVQYSLKPINSLRKHLSF